MKINAKIPEMQKPARDRAEDLKIGDVADDGSIYLGFHKGRDWFVAAEDIKDEDGKRLRLSFNEASKRAEQLTAHGHKDWKLPPGLEENGDPDVLRLMCTHKNTGAFKGTYSVSKEEGSEEDWYWSSTNYPHKFVARLVENFSYGYTRWANEHEIYSARCVRSVKRPKR